MINRKSLRIILSVLLMASGKNLCAWWANNQSLNHDWNFKPSFHSKPLNSEARFTFVSGIAIEYMANPEGRDKSGNKVGTFQLYSPQNSVGQPYESWFTVAGANLAANNPQDYATLAGLNNGNLGLTQAWVSAGNGNGLSLDQLSIKADRTDSALTFYSIMSTELANFPGSIYLASYMPFKLVSVTDATVTPLNKTTDPDLSFSSDPSTVARIINNTLALSTQPATQNVTWSDFEMMLGWKNQFVQDNDNLKAVNVDLGVGFIFPLSDQVKNTNLFQTPIGTDGAFAVPFKAMVQAQLQERFLLTGQLDFYWFLNQTVTKRLRLNQTDTEMILSPAVRARINFAPFFKVTAKGTIISPCKCYWATVGYEYGRKTTDKVLTNDKSAPLGASYSAIIVNAAQQWQDADFHNLILNAGIDFETKAERLSPRLQAFVKVPLKGTRIDLFKIFGVELSLNF